MKKTLFGLLACLTFVTTHAQIRATTDNGRKVILNTDGTWVYSDGINNNNSLKPCQTANTGNVTFKNNTSKDIYIYYAANAGSMSGAQMIKVPAKSSKTARDISINNSANGVYQYKVTFEKVEGQPNLNNIIGETSGNFLVVQCDNIEEEIDI